MMTIDPAIAMDVPAYIPGSVIDRLIEATGFAQFDQTIGVEFKCKWLLQRIEILKEEATWGCIIHDKPELKQLVAELQFERRISDALRKTIESMSEQIESSKR